jgi:hypothetical protein
VRGLPGQRQGAYVAAERRAELRACDEVIAKAMLHAHRYGRKQCQAEVVLRLKQEQVCRGEELLS